jgi:hypothetical protein
VDIESDLDGVQWSAATKCKPNSTRGKALLGNDFEKIVFESKDHVFFSELLTNNSKHNTF